MPLLLKSDRNLTIAYQIGTYYGIYTGPLKGGAGVGQMPRAPAICRAPPRAGPYHAVSFIIRNAVGMMTHTPNPTEDKTMQALCVHYVLSFNS